MTAGAKLFGLFQLAAQEEDKRHNQAAEQERDPPAPFTDGALFQHRVQRKAHCGGHHNRHLLTAGLPAGKEAFATRRGNFSQVDRHAAKLRPGGKALQQASRQHQQRCPQADALIRGDQHNQEGAGRHNRQGGDQPFTTTDLVDVSPEDNRANGAHQEACAKDGEGHHQRRKLTARREEGMRDVGGIEPEQEEVELLKEIARGDAKYRARSCANGCRWG